MGPDQGPLPLSISLTVFCRHWVLFDNFARRVLYSSRYTIELPSADSVFDLYPQPEDGKLEVFDGKYLSSRVKVVPESFTILPQVWLGPRGLRELFRPAAGMARPRGCELPTSWPGYGQAQGGPHELSPSWHHRGTGLVLWNYSE